MVAPLTDHRSSHIAVSNLAPAAVWLGWLWPKDALSARANRSMSQTNWRC